MSRCGLTPETRLSLTQCLPCSNLLYHNHDPPSFDAYRFGETHPLREPRGLANEARPRVARMACHADHACAETLQT